MKDERIFLETRLGERLKSLRGDVSQQKFAAQFGVKQTTYCNWERGAKEPSLAMVCTIASHFGVTVDWLLGMTDVRGGVSVTATGGSAVAAASPGATVSTSDPEVERLRGEVSALERVVRALTGGSR